MKRKSVNNHSNFANNKLNTVKAVILAGGKGTRLYPITKEIPKPLLPVNGKPILNHIISLFHSYGIKEIAILINKKFREDFDWWGKRYYLKENIKIFEEKEPLGTFGGLGLLKDWLGDAYFFLTNGDELKDINLFKMVDFHQKIKAPATIALVKVKDPRDYGVAIYENCFISKFLEKPKNPPSNYVSAGLYLLSPEIFSYYSGLKFSMIEKDILPKLAKEKKLAGFKFNGKWIDCGTWKRYSDAIEKWQFKSEA